MSGQGSGPTLRVGTRPGRGFGTVAPPRTNPGPASRPHPSAATLDSPKSRPGHLDLHFGRRDCADAGVAGQSSRGKDPKVHGSGYPSHGSGPPTAGDLGLTKSIFRPQVRDSFGHGG